MKDSAIAIGVCIYESFDNFEFLEMQSKFGMYGICNFGIVSYSDIRN